MSGGVAGVQLHHHKDYHIDCPFCGAARREGSGEEELNRDLATLQSLLSHVNCTKTEVIVLCDRFYACVGAAGEKTLERARFAL